MNDTERRAVAALASVYSTRMLGLFMVLPVFALLGPDLTGATPALIGLAIGIYGLTQACLQVPFGLLSDRLGRKRLIYIGLVIFAAGSVLAAASDHIYGVIAGRALQGAGAIASVLMALISDLTRAEERTKAMATIGISIGLSFSLSLILGPLLGEIAGLAGIFYLTAVLALVAMVIVWRLVPNPSAMITQGEHLPARSMVGKVLADPRLLRLDFGIFALHLVLTALFIQVPVLLSETLALAIDSLWWFYLTVMVTSFFAMVPFIIFGEKKQQMKIVLCGAVGLLVLASAGLWQWATSLTAAWFALFFFFMAFNLLEASLPSLISKEAPAGAKGTAMGVYSTAQFFGAFLGGAAGGVLSGWAGADGVYTLMVLVLLVWLLLAVTMPSPSYRDRFVIELNENGADEGSSAVDNERTGVNHGTRC
ncbi:Predicted arabinose efflux permease, MFS family [Marinobacter daqiaonensis]|uniref:Predicted arabinose efflux permease, MFS family n=1 Tax=Marinobacter daqiaonensis TaxID=650891 RepID=A0A1I6K0W9_9GAMM|nr:MFS transporter [Marinobacter daqiaonensis]SFR84873.1 Predicted arabinose efflux permease, MFS family [Marinobacter daqiaonensis]